MWFSIVGPTAVGKTQFAFDVAKRLIHDGVVTGVDIISADSRQVYKGLDCISGVDIPAGYLRDPNHSYPLFSSPDSAIRLMGISMVAANQEWSVAHFQDFARECINQATQLRRLAIVVGGTGLYHQQLTQSDRSLHVGPNSEVREAAEQQRLEELQSWLQRINPAKFELLNQSDRANPRRLIRAIEITIAQQAAESTQVTRSEPSYIPLSPALTIGLKDSLEAIEARINQRVTDRIAAGAVAELERLVDSYPNLKLPIYSSTGVKPLLAVISGVAELGEAQELWARQERQYAKRQITWFKKQPDYNWFSISEVGWQEKALEVIRQWLASE